MKPRMSMRNHAVRPGDRAFTLIELLTVVAVIAVLVSMLLPAVARLRKQARAVQCSHNLREIGSAVMIFATNNDSRGPGGGNFGSPPSGSSMSWHTILNAEVFEGKQYIPRFAPTEGSKLYCPEAYFGYSTGTNARSYHMNTNVALYNKPADIATGTLAAGSLQVRGAKLQYLNNKFYNSGTLWNYNYGPKLNTFRSASTKYLINEGDRAEVFGSVDPLVLLTRGHPAYLYPWGADKITQTGGGPTWSFRHPTLRMNMLFIDGHVESLAFGPKVALNIYVARN
jgi:prepilin-type N-terminal cleavage/methylation domain-containing protein/prepilin-type processing-associated H-X9-DG protein